jgi:hypothetical protein
MYGDTAAMRRRSAQLREQGTDVRAMADSMVGQLDAIGWQGRAAGDLRTRILDRAAHLRDCAVQHENAAEAVEKHLAEIDRLKDAVADIERKARSLVADARVRIAHAQSHQDPSGVVREPTDADRRLDSFTPPPSGHKDWLTLSIPGL